MSLIATLPTLSKRAKFYRQNGYWIEKGLIKQESLDILLQQIKHAFSQQLQRFNAKASEQWPLRDLMNGLFQASLPTYQATAKLVQYLPALVQLTVEPKILAICQELGITTPIIALRQVFHFLDRGLQIPGGYAVTPPHQDWRSMQGSLDSIVGWFTLLDEGTSFPLEVVPGSHRSFLPTVDDVFGHRIADQSVPALEDFVALDPEPGDLLMFSAFLIHRTGEREGDGFRISASFRYNNLEEPTFIERGYPHPYFCKPDFTVVTPDFPQDQDLEKVFDQ